MADLTLLQPIASQTTTPLKSQKQLKLFVFTEMSGVEEKVNEWLSENDVFLLHMNQSQCEKGGKFLFVLSLVYCRK